MNRSWLDQRERGNLLAYRFMGWVALHLGRQVARTFLYPICAYFVLFSAKTSQSFQAYLTRVLNRPAKGKDQFRQYHCFASMLLDRVYLLNKQYQHFDVDFHGLENLLEVVDQKQGCILLGSHLGSFEVVRASALSGRNVEVKFVMNGENAQMLNTAAQTIAPRNSHSIIHIGGPDSMLEVKECLDRGGVVGILGDRIVKGEKFVTCPFLGKPATFPAGPLVLASVVKVPVFLFFGLYRGGNRYEIHFELFAEQIVVNRRHENKTFKNGLNDMLTGWNITVGWPQTIGLIFMIFGMNSLEVVVWVWEYSWLEAVFPLGWKKNPSAYHWWRGGSPGKRNGTHKSYYSI